MTLWDDEPSYIITDVQVSTKVAPARASGADAVADDLHSLSIGDTPTVYEAEWRTKIAFEEEKSTETKSSVGVAYAASC